MTDNRSFLGYYLHAINVSPEFGDLILSQPQVQWVGASPKFGFCGGWCPLISFSSIFCSPGNSKQKVEGKCNEH